MEAGSQESAFSFDVSSEKYEGMIAKIAPKKSTTQEKEVGFFTIPQPVNKKLKEKKKYLT